MENKYAIEVLTTKMNEHLASQKAHLQNEEDYIDNIPLALQEKQYAKEHADKAELLRLSILRLKNKFKISKRKPIG